MAEERYRIDFSEEASKGLSKLDKQVQKRILLAVDKLRTNPRPDGVKKLKGGSNEWRIRVGDWRIVYEIHDGRLVVIVLDVDHRSKVYKTK
ncbi:type II toxin-antitoxin system RelE/ParE family toxin [Glycomyces endophyticus]|uniref:Type II toxin-antitoxin system RelE/ParE family toxin n=1 Tax=Glycomyces endophyticus TaxID=480996 RepID=A0ABP4TIX8_9ACTN